METAIKERLVGAAVLVVLVVLVVPALLRGPREPVEPEAPAAADTRVVEINLAGAAGKPEDMPPSTLQSSLPPVDTPAAAPMAVLPEPVSQDASGAEPGADGDPQDVGAAREAGPARPELAAPPAVAPPPESGWAVQLAALSKRDAAERMVADLRGRGYPAFVLEHRADGKALYRVRVGPEAQRDRAEVLARRLQDDGFKTSVVSQP